MNYQLFIFLLLSFILNSGFVRSSSVYYRNPNWNPHKCVNTNYTYNANDPALTWTFLTTLSTDETVMFIDEPRGSAKIANILMSGGIVMWNSAPIYADVALKFYPWLPQNNTLNKRALIFSNGTQGWISGNFPVSYSGTDYNACFGCAFAYNYNNISNSAAQNMIFHIDTCVPPVPVQSTVSVHFTNMSDFEVKLNTLFKTSSYFPLVDILYETTNEVVTPFIQLTNESFRISNINSLIHKIEQNSQITITIFAKNQYNWSKESVRLELNFDNFDSSSSSFTPIGIAVTVVSATTISLSLFSIAVKFINQLFHTSSHFLVHLSSNAIPVLIGLLNLFIHQLQYFAISSSLGSLNFNQNWRHIRNNLSWTNFEQSLKFLRQENDETILLHSNLPSLNFYANEFGGFPQWLFVNVIALFHFILLGILLIFGVVFVFLKIFRKSENATALKFIFYDVLFHYFSFGLTGLIHSAGIALLAHWYTDTLLPTSLISFVSMIFVIFVTVSVCLWNYGWFAENIPGLYESYRKCFWIVPLSILQRILISFILGVGIVLPELQIGVILTSHITMLAIYVYFKPFKFQRIYYAECWAQVAGIIHMILSIFIISLGSLNQQASLNQISTVWSIVNLFLTIIFVLWQVYQVIIDHKENIKQIYAAIFRCFRCQTVQKPEIESLNSNCVESPISAVSDEYLKIHDFELNNNGIADINYGNYNI